MTREQLLIDNEKKIREVVLTEKERDESYFEGQKRKYFKEKFKPYWDKQDGNTELHNIDRSREDNL